MKLAFKYEDSSDGKKVSARHVFKRAGANQFQLTFYLMAT